ncbi:hypothetical protein CDL15_Pgr013407 [Punica granatum]|uniref:Uncharacterized protein n=1 Tax=Punica granatum TaxID=22663 RepID=A0A218W1K6_PUNGR|nr:hypothetical protein CDL15_Pgr013407 [Punica granatum]PKI61460.1 hypothetical protein CRG98_018143 [Punica granatum]
MPFGSPRFWGFLGGIAAWCCSVDRDIRRSFYVALRWCCGTVSHRGQRMLRATDQLSSPLSIMFVDFFPILLVSRGSNGGGTSPQPHFLSVARCKKSRSLYFGIVSILQFFELSSKPD